MGTSEFWALGRWVSEITSTQAFGWCQFMEAFSLFSEGKVNWIDYIIHCYLPTWGCVLDSSWEAQSHFLASLDLALYRKYELNSWCVFVIPCNYHKLHFKVSNWIATIKTLALYSYSFYIRFPIIAITLFPLISFHCYLRTIFTTINPYNVRFCYLHPNQESTFT